MLCPALCGFGSIQTKHKQTQPLAQGRTMQGGAANSLLSLVRYSAWMWLVSAQILNFATL
jgi:hypothetical protein